MKKFFIQVAVILMLLSGGHTVGHHDHVHYECPEWENIADSAIHTSGTTSSGYFYFIRAR